MPNSSDWVAGVGENPSPSPSWITALKHRREFCEGLPFAKSAQSFAGASQMNGSGSSGDIHEGKTQLEQAFAEGKAAGLAEAQAELARANDRQRAVRLAFRTLDQAAMDALADELTETVIALCGQVMEASAIDQERLMERAKAAAQVIGSAAEECTLLLNPADISALGEDALADWNVAPESAIHQGGLRLRGHDGEVHDGPDQWRRAIAEALRG